MKSVMNEIKRNNLFLKSYLYQRNYGGYVKRRGKASFNIKCAKFNVDIRRGIVIMSNQIVDRTLNLLIYNKKDKKRNEYYYDDIFTKTGFQHPLLILPLINIIESFNKVMDDRE